MMAAGWRAEGEWDELDAAVQRFQRRNMAIKYAPRPVVAAPFGITLGGGCEIALHAACVQASAETYMGLVEAGVGLVPAGGGCKELLLRTGDLQKAFDLIANGKIAGSAEEARQLGPAARAGPCLDEPRAAHRRRQSAGAFAGSGLGAGRPAAGYQGRKARPVTRC